MIEFDVARLVRDFGGAASVAKICSVWRTAPYAWIKRRYISSRNLEKLKNYEPDLELDGYFNDDKNRRSSGVNGKGVVYNTDTPRHKAASI
tara:strand:- start:36 stop:308 length:273 start_codon:yes stop_codon:yes gene_type:complete